QLAATATMAPSREVVQAPCATGVCRGSSEFLSALGRRHLAADLAAWVGLGVNFDVPSARRHLLRLFGRERGLTFDGVANGGALFAQPDQRRGIFAVRCRLVEMRHGGRAGEAAM